MVEIIPLSEIESFEDNAKEALGAAYDKALKKSIGRFAFKGAMILTPRCSPASAPALARRYGDTGKYIAADGNKRLERLGALGFGHVLVLPGLDAKSGGLDMDAMLRAAPVLREYDARTRGGEKIALGISYPDLNTPEQVQAFMLSFDRARARYDEGKVQFLLRELVDERGEDQAELEALFAVRRAAVADMLRQEARGIPGATTDAAERTPEQKVAERKAARALLRVPVGPFMLTAEQEQKFRALMDALKGTVPDKLTAILARAHAACLEDEILLGYGIEVSWQVHEAARA